MGRERAAHRQTEVARRALTRVLSDLPISFGHDRCRVLVLTRSTDTDTQSALSEWLGPDDDMVVLLSVDDNTTSFEPADEECLAWNFASTLQDTIIDESGAPWPLSPDGRPLDCVVNDDLAVWTDRRGWSISVGSYPN